MRRLPHLRRWQLSGGLFAALVGCGALIAGFATATDKTPKYFTATVSVSPDADLTKARADAFAGAIPTITISIKNKANPQSLGSANVTIPPGIVPDPPLTTGNVIKLRDLNLAPGATTSVSLTARIPCTPNGEVGYPWTVAVKQSNNFNGTGNDFTPATAPPRLYGSGTCKLAFAAGGQPANAQRLANITAAPYLPGGSPIAVKVLDGSGNAPVAWWPYDVTLGLATNPAPGSLLQGDVTATPGADGVARFATGGTGPSITTSAVGYRLNATSVGTNDSITAPPPVSSEFDIVDTVARCAGGPCTGKAANANFDTTVTAPNAAAGDLVIMSLGAPGTPTPDCQGYVETTDTLAFDVSTPNVIGANKTVLYKILNPFKPAAQYDVCFRVPPGSPSFTTKSLTQALQQPDGSYVGLLPDCRRVCGIVPCLADRGEVGKAVVLTVLASKGDPWLRG